MDILWVEEYRPQTINDCILPDRSKQPFSKYVETKEIPHLLLCGSAGVGKTTVAIAMCKEIGCDYMFINGSKENGIDTLRTKIESYASSVSLAGGRKAIIIDEADAMTFQLQQGLRGCLEQFAANCSFIFTCNFKNKIMDPIHSRCVVIDFKLTKNEKTQMAGSFFKRVLDILNQKGVQYDKEVVAAVITKHFPDYRRILNAFQHYSKFGNIDSGILSQINDVSLNDLVKMLKAKDYGKIRKWVGENPDLDPTTFYRNLYDICNKELKPETIPQMVLILAKYQYQGAFVADQEINILACLVEVMVDCEFK